MALTPQETLDAIQIAINAVNANPNATIEVWFNNEPYQIRDVIADNRGITIFVSDDN